MIVGYAKSFQSDIEKINDFDVLTRLKNILHMLEQATSLNEIHNLKKLKSSSGNYYRIRLGDYRIGLKFEGERLMVVRFLHRKEVYRYFP